MDTAWNLNESVKDVQFDVNDAFVVEKMTYESDVTRDTTWELDDDDADKCELSDSKQYVQECRVE